MRIAHLAAGAGGMYCGSCMHDNRLAATLIEQGREVVLIPLYTPLRTDEIDVSGGRIYYGGINTYLQQISAFFRHTPAVFDRLFDWPALLRGVGKLASRTRPEDLGEMTLSVMRGEDGRQRKELGKLIDGLRTIGPDLIHLPNLLFIGLVGRIKAELDVPVVCGLVGEDIFLDRLSEPYKGEVFQVIRERAGDADGYIALSDYYAAHAGRHFGLPAERVWRVPMGIRAADYSRVVEPPAEPFTIGYLARICSEKGVGRLCEAFIELRRLGRECRLRVAGFLGGGDRAYFEKVCRKIRAAGIKEAEFDYVGEVTREEKIRFLHSLHVLAAPTVYPESKGFYVLEALAAGVPVVVPDHGSFPEIIEATGGGVLHASGDRDALVAKLIEMMDDTPCRRQCATEGSVAVARLHSAETMAAAAWSLYERLGSRS